MEILEMGKISSRGQVAIPMDIRKEMGLGEGAKILFFLEEDTLIIKKLSAQTWEQLTKPLREQKKKLKEKEVAGLVHRMRKL
jgi:AbrB family looped-hinge helix DNA binding protein